MQYDENTPRNERTISGVKVQVIAPYAEGQTITAAEASMLNQTIAENFSNNLRERIGKFVPEGSPEGTEPRVATAEEAQAIVEAYASKYQPGVRQGGGGGARALDPVEKEMKVIATAKLDAFLKEKGLTRKKVEFSTLLSKLIADNESTLRTSAEKIVAARQKQTGGELDLSGVSVG